MRGIFNGKTMKKVQCIMLCVCMLFSILSVGMVASAAEPVIDSVTLDESRTEVTITFTSEITEASGSYMKKNIKLSQDGGSELALANFATVTVRTNAIVIRLPEPLTKSKNYFVIAKGALKNQNKAITTPNINGTDPIIKASEGVTIDDSFKVITIKFTTMFTGYPDDNALKNGYITLARDGVKFDEVIPASQIQVNGSKAELVITLDKPLSGAAAKIKIGHSRIKSTVTGNVNLNDIVTPSINAIKSEAPVYKSIKVEYEGAKITMSFDRDIKRSQGITDSMFKSNVKLSRNEGGFSNLSSNDKVQISGKDVIITLNYPLTGNGNRVSINSGVLSAVESNDVLRQVVYSDYMNMGAATTTSVAPKYAGIVYDRENKVVRIYFDTDIRAVSTYKLLNGVDIEESGQWNRFTDCKNIEIYNNNSVLISLSRALSGSTRFRIAGGTIMDYSENIQKNNQYTDFVSEKGTGLYTDEPEIEKEDTQDNTQTGEDANKEETSTENNAGTAPEEDVEINTNPGTQIADKVMVMLNGLAVDFSNNSVATNSAGVESHVVEIVPEKAQPVLSTKSKGVALSVVIPTLAYGGTVKIPGSIIKLLDDKESVITVECANAVHRIPLSILNVSKITTLMNIPYGSINDVTVELAIHRASNIYKNDLEKEGGISDFSTIIAPMEFTIQYKSNNTTRAVTTFDDYVEKSFVISKNDADNGTSIVRIETSGKINPVPSNLSVRSNGDAYITASTRQNGVYAVINSQKTYADTPNWATTAVNSLLRRQILSDFTGYNLKPSQTATRAEVAGIITKAMGVYTDIEGASKFFDVTLTDSYYTSVAVAVKYGIINGYGDNTFKPDRSITRQEAAAILARTMRLAQNQNTSNSSSLTLSKAENIIVKFKDASKIDDWAKSDLAECVSAGIINGDNNGNVNPSANVTRAEIIQMVYNLLTRYGYINK